MSAVKGLLGLNKMKAPKPPKLTSHEAASVAEAEEEQRRLAMNAKGRSSTLFKGFGGDQSKATVGTKTLLGQ